ncbi:hypothetical protein, partial [Rhizobium sp. Leaf321]|uniref:hypothetical protein n=1 Tax=Rhizobium sp. Leaf321 TaxID=1736335 RepID=UPI001AEC053F
MPEEKPSKPDRIRRHPSLADTAYRPSMRFGQATNAKHPQLMATGVFDNDDLVAGAGFEPAAF